MEHECEACEKTFERDEEEEVICKDCCSDYLKDLLGSDLIVEQEVYHV